MKKVIILILVAILSFNYTYSQKNNQPIAAGNSQSSELEFELTKNLEIFIELYKNLNIYYVDDVNPAELIQTGIDAMLKSLDPYTVFYAESDAEDFRFLTTGSYGGIGSTISTKDDKIVITEPYEGFPAQKSGLRAGDVILEVNGKSAIGKSSDEITTLLKGQPGTSVEILIERPGTEKPFNVTIERENVTLKNVPYYGMLDNNIGYIILSGFKRDAAKDVKDALLDLKNNNDLKGLVLDLRGNPGGLLIEAVKIVNIFVDKGELIVSTRGKVESWNNEYKTFDQPLDTEIPLVVLVNSGSASASEIVAGSIQDLDRGVIIGERTLGKGLVQTTKALVYNTQMKVTTSKYYIPSGRCIQEIDYSHKDKDGKAIKIADSLKHEFKTKNGRIVYDSKGIAPDIKVGDEKYNDLLRNLMTERVIFDFATQYRLNHDEIADAAEFKLTDEDYNKFIEFVSGQDFTYQTATEKQLEKLKEKAEKDKYLDEIEDELTAIESAINESKKGELKTYQEMILPFIENEIVSRYYYQTGRILNRLENDKEIEKAIEVLISEQAYSEVLAP